MRPFLALLPLALVACPASAAADDGRTSSILSDPAMPETLGRVMGDLTRALMDLPVGQLEAAVEGREPTQADRQRRVRDAVGGPDAERQVEESVAASGRQVQLMGKALLSSIPSIMASLENVERELERATANIPDPTYPRR